MVLFINQVLDTAIENNGGTFYKVRPANATVAWSADTHREYGYWVSLGKGVENLPKLRLQTVYDFVDSRPRIAAGETFLGLWNEEFKGASTQNWSIDESVWVGTREEAIQIGLENSQKAIYDIFNDLVITL